MTTVLIKKATIIDSESPFHNQQKDILIENGTIKNIADDLSKESHDTLVTMNDLHVSQGWFDSSVSFGEPGYEERETIANGLQVAAKSGFTAVALQPNSFPVIDNQSQVKFVLERAKNQATTLFPIGALTKNSEGTDLAELFDMKNSGAIAFGDYKKSMTNANLLKIAFQYVDNFNGILFVQPMNKDLKGKGFVNEGEVSTKLGLKGIPAMAEEIEIERNIALLEYTNGKLHIPTITTKNSVDLIAKAQAKGLQITCGVSANAAIPYNLYFGCRLAWKIRTIQMEGKNG